METESDEQRYQRALTTESRYTIGQYFDMWALQDYDENMERVRPCALPQPQLQRQLVGVCEGLMVVADGGRNGGLEFSVGSAESRGGHDVSERVPEHMDRAVHVPGARVRQRYAVGRHGDARMR